MKQTLLAIFLICSIPGGSASPLSLIEPEVAWSKKNLRVCFAVPEEMKRSVVAVRSKITEESLGIFEEDQKESIKTILSTEYTPSKTGIHFSGWEDCQNDPQSDIFIYRVIDKAAPFIGTASLGENGILSFVDAGTFSRTRVSVYKKQNTSKKAYVAINTSLLGRNKLKQSEELAMVALHEFGHVAGLRHEHADKMDTGKRFSDKNCTAVKFEYSEGLLASTVKYSVYDPNSIMSYCFMYLLGNTGLEFSTSNEKIASFDFKDPSLITQSPIQDGVEVKIKLGLSQGNLHALKCLYVYNSKLKRALCREEYNPLDP